MSAIRPPLRPSAMPVSPPETDRESSYHAGASNYPPLLNEKLIRNLQSVSSGPSSPLHTTQDASSDPRYHRTSSSLPYTRSPIPDTRRPVGRGPRWLVMVLPPPTLHREPVLDGVPSNHGPPERFLNGTLLPLQTTFFGQLNTIAREFALPSTIGICLYLQVSEAGQNFSPRLSDESWPALWAPFLSPSEDRPAQHPSGLPIAGRIEFDLDLRLAKWYQGWMSGTLTLVPLGREGSYDSSEGEKVTAVERSQPAPAADEVEGYASENGARRFSMMSRYYSVGTPSVASGSTPRQGPKRLSLLGRREKSDLPSIRPPSAPPVRLSHYSLDSASASTSSKMSQSRNTNDQDPLTAVTMKPHHHLHHALSPIPQMDTPPTSSRHHQKDVNTFVQEWRHSSASATPLPLPSAERAHKSPSPELSEHFMTPPIDPADYQWSISSRGPPSPIPTPLQDPPLSNARSVHIMDRMYGSLDATPSWRTSWGPSDRSFDYNLLTAQSRVATPDIAERMIEDAPSTSDRGAQEEAGVSRMGWPYPEPLEPDVQETAGGSRMGWPYVKSSEPEVQENNGTAKMGWPYVQPQGQEVHETDGSKMGWPYHHQAKVDSISSSASSKMGWPYHKPSEPDHQLDRVPEQPSELGWPYSPATRSSLTTEPLGPPKMSWPYVSTAAESSKTETADAPSKMGWPYSGPAKGVVSLQVDIPESTAHMGWPYSSASRLPSTTSLPTVSPLERPTESPVTLPRPTASYPTFDLYPQGYPSLEIYPIVTAEPKDAAPSKSLPVTLPSPTPSYPDFELYLPGYPALTIYPNVSGPVRSPSRAVEELERTPVLARLPPNGGYPIFDLYPAGYPTLDIYPPLSLGKSTERRQALEDTTTRSYVDGSNTPSSATGLSYPVLDIYPAIYPFVSPYPPIMTSPVSPLESRPLSQLLRNTQKDPSTIPLPPTPPSTAPRRRERSGTLSYKPRPKASNTPYTPTEDFSSPVSSTTASSREELHALIFGNGPMSASPETLPEGLSPAPSSGLDSPSSASVSRYDMFSPVVRMPIVLPSPTSPVASSTRPLPVRHLQLGRRSTMSSPLAMGGEDAAMPRPFSARRQTLKELKEAEDVPVSAGPSPPSTPIRRRSSLGKLRTNDDFFKQRQLMHNSPRGSSPPGSANSSFSGVSQFPSPPGMILSASRATAARPVSRLDPSSYGFH